MSVEVYDDTLEGAARFARDTLAALIDTPGTWPNKAKVTYTAWKKLDAALSRTGLHHVGWPDSRETTGPKGGS